MDAALRDKPHKAPGRAVVGSRCHHHHRIVEAAHNLNERLLGALLDLPAATRPTRAGGAHAVSATRIRGAPPLHRALHHVAFANAVFLYGPDGITLEIVHTPAGAATDVRPPPSRVSASLIMTDPVHIGGATRAGTHSCRTCGYERDVLTADLPACPRCGSTEWVSVSDQARPPRAGIDATELR